MFLEERCWARPRSRYCGRNWYGVRVRRSCAPAWSAAAGAARRRWDLLTGNENVELVAMADIFEDHLERLAQESARPEVPRRGTPGSGGAQRRAEGDDRAQNLVESIAPRINGGPDRHFVGFDAYQKLAKSDARYRHADHAAGLPADALRGRGGRRQARLHREADRHRCHRRAPLPGGRTQSRRRRSSP